MANFDKTRYIGKWYQQAREYTNFFTPGVQCVTMEFSPIRSDGSFDQNYRGVFVPIWTYVTNDGVYYQCGEDSTLKWTCQATMGGGTIRGDIRIYDTDYDNYKILYTCDNWLGGLMKYQQFGLFARKPTMEDDAYAKAKEAIKTKLPAYDLDWWAWSYEWVWQNNNDGTGVCDYESGWLYD